jgi:hypothetical protein
MFGSDDATKVAKSSSCNRCGNTDDQSGSEEVTVAGALSGARAAGWVAVSALT